MKGTEIVRYIYQGIIESQEEEEQPLSDSDFEVIEIDGETGEVETVVNYAEMASETRRRRKGPLW